MWQQERTKCFAWDNSAIASKENQGYCCSGNAPATKVNGNWTCACPAKYKPSSTFPQCTEVYAEQDEYKINDYYANHLKKDTLYQLTIGTQSSKILKPLAQARSTQDVIIPTVDKQSTDTTVLGLYVKIVKKDGNNIALGTNQLMIKVYSGRRQSSTSIGYLMLNDANEFKISTGNTHVWRVNSTYKNESGKTPAWPRTQAKNALAAFNRSINWGTTDTPYGNYETLELLKLEYRNDSTNRFGSVVEVDMKTLGITKGETETVLFGFLETRLCPDLNEYDFTGNTCVPCEDSYYFSTKNRPEMGQCLKCGSGTHGRGEVVKNNSCIAKYRY